MKDFTYEEMQGQIKMLEMVDDAFDVESQKRYVAAEYDKRLQQEAGFTGKVRHKPTNITPKKKKRKK